MKTFRVLPHVKSHGMALVNIKELDGDISPLCTRAMAQTQIERLKQLGLSMYCGFENEFYLLHKMSNEPIDSTNYCYTSGLNDNALLLNDIADAIVDLGYQPWLVHAEVSGLSY